MFKLNKVGDFLITLSRKNVKSEQKQLRSSDETKGKTKSIQKCRIRTKYGIGLEKKEAAKISGSKFVYLDMYGHWRRVVTHEKLFVGSRRRGLREVSGRHFSPLFSSVFRFRV